MTTRVTIPNLVLAQRVIDKMAAAAAQHLEDETGEAMVGVVMPGENTNGVPTIYVLDTISPDDDNTVRRQHTFQQGDDRQDELIIWLQENWDVKRQKRRGSYGGAQQAKWDAPLRYLGDWHKQPGSMIAPSGGDLMTALGWLDDPDTTEEALLVPIVTLDHPGVSVSAGVDANYLTAPLKNGTMRVDFWYIHRDGRTFQPIKPVIYPDEQLPGLTAYPWHIKDEARADREFKRFFDNQMFYSIVLWDADGDLPLEVCITAARMGGSKIFMIVTPWNYPEARPHMRLTPYTAISEQSTIRDVFSKWWAESEAVEDPPGWEWTADKTLYDYVCAVESAHNLRPEPAEPAEDAESTAQVEAGDAINAGNTTEDER